MVYNEWITKAHLIGIHISGTALGKILCIGHIYLLNILSFQNSSYFYVLTRLIHLELIIFLCLFLLILLPFFFMHPRNLNIFFYAWSTIALSFLCNLNDRISPLRVLFFLPQITRLHVIYLQQIGNMFFP